MSLQYKPFNTREPVYAPSRDIAFILELLARDIVPAFQSENMTSWISEHIAAHQLDEARLQDAVRRFYEALSNFRDPAFMSAGSALQASGFYDLPEPARLAVFAALGQVVASYYFVAVREALAIPNMAGAPRIVMATPQVVEAIEAGRAVMNQDRRVLDDMAAARECAVRENPELASFSVTAEPGQKVGW